METYEVLELLIEAVEEIDGGCNRCIEGFLFTANESLSKAGIQYRFAFKADKWQEHPIKLEALGDSFKGGEKRE